MPHTRSEAVLVSADSRCSGLKKRRYENHNRSITLERSKYFLCFFTKKQVQHLPVPVNVCILIFCSHFTHKTMRIKFQGFCFLKQRIMFTSVLVIRITCPYNVFPLYPTDFHIAKLGFAGVYLFFLILRTLLVLVSTASAYMYPRSMF